MSERHPRDPIVADDLREFKAKMRTLRRQAGKTQTQVAVEMGTTQSHVSEMEALNQDLNLATVRRYLKAVGAELVLESDEPYAAYTDRTIHYPVKIEVIQVEPPAESQ